MKRVLFVMVVLVIVLGMGTPVSNSIEYTDPLCSKELARIRDNILKEEMRRDHKSKEIFYKILFLKPSQSYKTANKIAAIVMQKSEEYKVDSDLIISLMRLESGFNPYARSKAGAQGLMQVMPFWTWKGKKCHGKNLWDMEQNIDCGIQIYLHYLKKYGGDQNIALVTYNRGPWLVNKSLKKGEDPDNGYARNVNKYLRRLKKVNDLSKNLEFSPLYASLTR